MEYEGARGAVGVEGKTLDMILIFDTETTGLPKDYYAPESDTDNWPRIVQLAWQIYDLNGNLVEESNNIIKPTDFIIPEEATQFHSISNEYAQRYGSELNYVLNAFKDKLNTIDIVVGHNIEFDIKILKAEFYRTKIRESFNNTEEICTMQSATSLCKIENTSYGYKYPSLEELHFYLFKTSFENAHNALVDVRITAKCFWKLRALGYFEDSFKRLYKREEHNKANAKWGNLSSKEKGNLTKLYDGLYHKPAKIYEILNMDALVCRNLMELTSLHGISQIRKLETLNIQHSKIKDLTDIQSAKLKYIILEHHEYLEDISAVEKCKNLRMFAINQTKIKDITPLKKLKNLYQLSIDNSPVSDLDIINELELEDLSCSNLKISDLKFLSKHKKLTRLNLKNNNLVDLTPIQFNTGLVSLNLSGNKNIKDISVLSKFKKLKNLELNYTGVNDLSPLIDCKLSRLEISGLELKTFKFLKNQKDLLVNFDPNFRVMLDNSLNNYVSISKVRKKDNLFKINGWNDDYGLLSYLTNDL